jgi:ABC-type multidrug transport system fused ATPase/permease subunit
MQSNLSHWYFSLLRFLGSSKRIHDMLHRKPLIDNSTNPLQLAADSKPTVEFKNVSFKYPTRPEAQVLHNVNLSMKRGKITALVGPSGGGKSTVCALLQRFYDPTEGSIYIGGTDLKDIDLNWLPRFIGTVSQEPYLFSSSIADNIAYGKPSATMDQIIDAAKKANAHDFISKFPDGYDTLCGEKGALLSGGQKQRIAMARCFILQPEIILIDEGTSALDSESEYHVQQALYEIAKGRTVLIIAHRLSTIQLADQICVVQDGTIVESGTHNDLLNNQGMYSRLVKLQQLEAQINWH